MGKVISGRFGSVQRLLPIEEENGRTKWGPFKPNINGGKTSGLPAASMTDQGSILETDTVRHESTVSAITSWSLENTMQPITYTASNTRGYRGKLEGTHSATGNIAGIGAIPPIAPGQRFKFYGYTGPKSGKPDDYKGTVYSITAIANSVQVQINYQLQNPCTWTVGWQSDWQEPGDELWCNHYAEALYGDKGFWDYTDVDCSTFLPSTTKCLEIEGIQDRVCLLDANIQFQTEVSQFTNSCSSVVGGWQQCVIGPTDCTISANIHGDNYGDLYSEEAVYDYYAGSTSASNYDGLDASQKNRRFWPGSNHALKIYVGNNGAYWEFYKMMFGSFGGLNVDVTSNNPIQFSCNMEFNAYPQVGGECVPGYIIYNDGTQNIPLVDLRSGDSGSSVPDDKWKSVCSTEDKNTNTGSTTGWGKY